MSDERGDSPALPGPEVWNQLGEGKFPDYVGMPIVHVEVGLVRPELDVRWEAHASVGRDRARRAATEGADGRVMALLRCTQMVLG